jgi:hypothetical protein
VYNEQCLPPTPAPAANPFLEAATITSFWVTAPEKVCISNQMYTHSFNFLKNR